MTAKTLVVVASLALGSTASAGNKSWTAVKSKLPTSTAIVASFDLAAARKTATFAKVVETFTGRKKQVADAIALVKSICGIDALTALDSATVVLDANQHGYVALGMANLDEVKLIACIDKLAAHDDPKKHVTVTKLTGGVSQYQMTGDTDKFWLAWPARDVLAFDVDTSKHDAIDGLAKGKAATGDLATFLGKTTPTALAFGAATIGKDNINGGYGTMTLAKGKVTAVMRATMVSPDAAKSMVSVLTTTLAQASANTPPEITKLVKAVVVGMKGNDLTIDAVVDDADVAAMIPLLAKLF